MPRITSDAAALVAAQLTDTWARTHDVAPPNSDDGIPILVSAWRDFYERVWRESANEGGYRFTDR